MNDPGRTSGPSITRVDRPHPQPGPVAFALVGLVGAGIAIRGLVTLRPGSEQWWVGALALAVVVAGLAFIEGGWLWIQREVAFSDDAIVVRRWSEVLRGAPGRTIPLHRSIRVRMTSENVRSIRIECDGRRDVVFTLGYWDPGSIQELLAAFAVRGIAVLREDRNPSGA